MSRYTYSITLTDCDGFRIDTLTHVSFEEARNFCGAVKEFAANLGKRNYLLVGEVAGGDLNQGLYLEALERNLNAALDIGEMRPALQRVTKGRAHPMRKCYAFSTATAPSPAPRGADVLADADLSPPGSAMRVIANTCPAADGGAGYPAPHAVGSTVEVHGEASGLAYVEVRGVGPSETLVLVDHAKELNWIGTVDSTTG